MHLVNGVIVLLALTTVAHSKTKTQVCRSPECNALSAFITSNMDLMADPCEDFVQFACGNFPLNTQYDPDSVTLSQFTHEMEVIQYGIAAVMSSLEKKVFELLVVNKTIDSDDPDVSSMFRLTRSFYRSCVNWGFSRMQCFQSDCDRMASQKFFNGALTHLLDTIDERKVNGSFERALAQMVRMQFWMLFEIRPYDDVTQDASQLNVSRLQLLTNVESRNSKGKNVRKYLDFFRELEASSTLSPESLTEDAFNRVLQEVVNKSSSAQYSSIFNSLKSCSGSELNKLFYTIEELDFLTSCASSTSFSWSLFFKEYFENDAKDSVEFYLGGRLGDVAKIISIVDNFKSRSIWLGNGKLSPHFSFLAIDWLFSFASYFPQNLFNEWNEGDTYKRILGYVPTLKYSPVKDCIQVTKKLLGPVVELMYQKSHHADSFDDVSELVELVQNATVKSVREQTWITPESKEAIAEKILAQKSLIGFYELPTKELKVIYGQIIKDFNAGGYSSNSEDFGMLFSLASCAYSGLMRSRLTSGSPTPMLSLIGGLFVNAFNFGEENKIIFPMGILTPFLYHKSYPAYMNLGGIGVIIGHEIGHGFDNTGHELDKKGAYGHFWDNITETEYLKRMKCVESKFSNYEIVPGRPHPSDFTLGNDISDLMGIRSAFGALKSLGERGRLLSLPNLPSSLSPERLFFVQAAQAWCSKAEPRTLIEFFGESPSHSAPHIRIRGMIEHSRDFARVFQCKANQTMNPMEKCEFW